MKRFIISLSILTVIILSAFVTMFSIKSYNNTMIEKLDEAQELAQKEKTEDVLLKIEEIKRFWSDYYNHLSFIIQYEKTNNITSTIHCLETSLNNSTENFIYDCESLKSSFTLLYNEQVPSFNNII